MRQGFKDHFSVQANQYARFRSDYPPALFEHPARQAPSHELAWDCAIGNGQTARGLVTCFAEVIATDAGERRLAPFWPPTRIAVENGYPDPPFPLADGAPPGFAMTARWRLDQLSGYIGTWSATWDYWRPHGRDPVLSVAVAIRCAWGETDSLRAASWPLKLRLGVARRGGAPHGSA